MKPNKANLKILENSLLEMDRDSIVRFQMVDAHIQSTITKSARKDRINLCNSILAVLYDYKAAIEEDIANEYE